MAIEKVTGIVTDLVKHSDRHNVVTLFTREQGRVALLSPAGSGKSAKLRNATLMPLSVIATDINFSGTGELHYLGRFSRVTLWKDLYFNPIKTSIALFMSEFINAYTRETPPDPPLWDFILHSISELDRARNGFSNQHLAFLIEFMGYAGIKPDLSGWREDAWLDMRGGTMTLQPPPHRDILTPLRARVLPLLARMNARTAHVFRFNGTERRELLAELLHYYSLHFPGLSNLKSPQILAEVFS